MRQEINFDLIIPFSRLTVENGRRTFTHLADLWVTGKGYKKEDEVWFDIDRICYQRTDILPALSLFIDVKNEPEIADPVQAHVEFMFSKTNHICTTTISQDSAIINCG